METGIVEFQYFEVPISTTILKFTTRPLNYSSPLEVSNRSNFPQRLRNFYDSTVEYLLTCLVVKSWGMDILYSLLVLRLKRFHKNPPGTSHSENLWCCVGNSGSKQYEKKKLLWTSTSAASTKK